MFKSVLAALLITAGFAAAKVGDVLQPTVKTKLSTNLKVNSVCLRYPENGPGVNVEVCAGSTEEADGGGFGISGCRSALLTSGPNLTAATDMLTKGRAFYATQEGL